MANYVVKAVFELTAIVGQSSHYVVTKSIKSDFGLLERCQCNMKKEKQRGYSRFWVGSHVGCKVAYF